MKINNKYQMGQTSPSRIVSALLVVAGLSGALYWFWPRRHKNLRIAIRSSASQDQGTAFDRILYQISKTDTEQWGCNFPKLQTCSFIQQISYRVILALNKGLYFQGVMMVKFKLVRFKDDYLRLSFKGLAVRYARVNGRQIPQDMVLYHSHRIHISHSYLEGDAYNEVEIVFQNKYSFFDCGMGSLFWIDETEKYSLRQQVVFTCGEITRAIPCFECLNSCRLSLEVMHPDNFEVFSNTLKSIRKYSSLNDYPQHQFLLDTPPHSRNKIKRSQFSENRSAKSSNKAVAKLKSTSHFYAQQLPSIHSFAVYASDVAEVRVPSSDTHSLLIRSFCKPFAVKQVAMQINSLYAFINRVICSLEGERIESHLFKVDILLLDNPAVEGLFAPGMLYLPDHSFSSLRVRYLVARAFVGMILMKSKRLHFCTIDQIYFLNARVLRTFPQFRDFLLLKNLAYAKVRSLTQDHQYLKKHERSIVEYFSLELKYILKQVLESASPAVGRLQAQLRDKGDYWKVVVGQYAAIGRELGQQFVALGVKHRIAVRREDFRVLQGMLVHSKHRLYFFTDREIQQNLQELLKDDAYGLEKRLPFIEVEVRFKELIRNKYQTYLPIRQNIEGAWKLYHDFKLFQEESNFHHYELLRRQINRIMLFIGDELTQTRLPIRCDLLGWKLLSKLKIMPLDEQYYNIINVFKGIDD